MTTITYRHLMEMPAHAIGLYDMTAWDGGHQQDWQPSCSKAAKTQNRAFDGQIPVRTPFVSQFTAGVESMTIDYPRPTGYVDLDDIRQHVSTTGRTRPLSRPRRGLVWRFVGWIGGGR